MSRNTVIIGLALTAACLSSVHLCRAAEGGKGPQDMVLQTTRDKAAIPKPAKFPHAAHQAAFKCAVCHHGGKDGKQIPYVEGMAIQKCEECHYSGSGMPGADNADSGLVKIDTFKDAAHARCRVCHNGAKSKKPELQEKWKGCLPCHE
ncbi:MAG: cytochrome c3 family protein [Desulfocapsaceae bacterium]|nr:cytochrome c3 family protein [Desulfocapsaceae bacterium]